MSAVKTLHLFAFHVEIVQNDPCLM